MHQVSWLRVHMFGSATCTCASPRGWPQVPKSRGSLTLTFRPVFSKPATSCSAEASRRLPRHTSFEGAGRRCTGCSRMREATLCVRGWGSERCRVATNLQNQGLISVDRSNKATLLLTIPRSLFKSSAKDLSLPTFEIAIREPLV